MSVQLNHTIVFAKDRQVSAEFLAYILDLEIGAPFGPFLPITTANGVTLDFASMGDAPVAAQHYAFIVSEDEFDGIFERIKQTCKEYFADPHRRLPGEINHHDGGRGVYFEDPSGHGMEVITVPYGGWK